MKLKGYRKIVVFLLFLFAAGFGLYQLVDLLEVADKEKATWIAGVATTYFGAIGGGFATLMRAFRGTYERDAAIAQCKPPGP